MLINRELTRKEYYGIEASMQKSLVSMDRQIQAKRRMLAEIEKENVMTIAASSDLFRRNRKRKPIH